MTHRPIPKLHPLEGSRTLAALAVFAFSAVGVGLMDSRLSAGALMCFFAVLATLWLYSEDIIAMRSNRWKKWPWIGFVIIAIEVIVPLYVGLTKTYGQESPPANSVLPSIVSHSQQGGQSGIITNNGSTYNGPVTVNDVSQCPPNYSVLNSNIAEGNGIGYSFPADAKICLVNNQAIKNGTGYQIRPPEK